MATSPKQLFAACAVALAAAGLCAPAAAASPHETHPKAVDVLREQAREQAKAQAKLKKSKKAAPADTLPAEPEPDIAGAAATDYACELNNKLTIYTKDQDDAHIALRWKNRLHSLDRIGTTTGAQRFENDKTGLIWIGIPSKGILLDAKQGRQLANECKNADQVKPVVAAAAGEKNS
jgi:hypothetical protein